jgi:diamine N-acetyltransferase
MPHIRKAEITDAANLARLQERTFRDAFEASNTPEDLVAFAQLRTRKPPACVVAGRPLEIQRFYVLNEWHGKRLAHDLMTAVIERAVQQGADQVWLGVWEHNPRAIAFYRKWGFSEVGEQIFPLGTDPQRDIVMTRIVRPR